MHLLSFYFVTVVVAIILLLVFQFSFWVVAYCCYLHIVVICYYFLSSCSCIVALTIISVSWSPGRNHRNGNMHILKGGFKKKNVLRRQNENKFIL